MSARRTGQGVIKRALLLLALLGGALFALEGGEYGTTDLWRQRVERRHLRARIAALQHDVDSLTRVKRAVMSDPAVQERIAREEFGMVRGDREVLYRFAEPADSARKPPGAR